MSAHAPVIAVDLGTATITAAAAEPSKQPSPEVLQFDGHPDYSIAAKIDIEGAPHPATWNGNTEELVSQPFRLLNRPPQVIGDVILSGATLVSVSLGPALAAARAAFGHEPTTIIGVHPQWPAAVLSDYRRALEKQGLHVALVPWADAIATQTMPPLTGSHVTVLDFGASTASIVVVRFTRRGTPSVKFTYTDPAGGARGADRAVVAHCAAIHDVNLSDVDHQWWSEAEAQVNKLRRNRQSTTKEQAVTAEFPVPLGTLDLTWHDIDQITNSHMQAVVSRLIDHAEVTDAWDSDRTDKVKLPRIEATGGFANDPAVELAVRAAIGPVSVVEAPATAAAFGAVMLQAPKWIPAPEQTPKKGLFSRMKVGRG